MKQVKRTFNTTAQICWKLENGATPETFVYTQETLTLEREVMPDKGFFLYKLKEAIEKGRETPKPGIRYTATVLGIYGELTVKQLTGKPLGENGESQTDNENE
jgi:hypothetical protein